MAEKPKFRLLGPEARQDRMKGLVDKQPRTEGQVPGQGKPIPQLR